MRDFTSNRLQLLLSSLKSTGYSFTTVAGYLRNPSDSTVILRHDVDARPANSLKCAEMEHRMGITGTYYFRILRGSYDESVIRHINSLGHEIGYHYEDLAAAKGEYEKAITLFGENLAKLRLIAPVETICMHGSPMSIHDNRLLWQKYDYRDFGICGEPYLDIDFMKVHYLTDTGRRWNGEKFSVRDRVNTHLTKGKGRLKFRSTRDLIRAVESGGLPSMLMITIHPQRWDNRLIPWMQELIWQNIKNAVKRSMTAS